MVFNRFRKWLGRKSMPTGPGTTDPTAGVTITRDMLSAVKEAKAFLVSAKEGVPIYQRERNMLQTLNELSLQSAKGDNSFIQQLNTLSVHKATWYSSLTQVAQEMEKHIQLTEQLTVKAEELQNAIKEEKEALAAKGPAAMTKESAAYYGEMDTAREDAFRAFSSIFAEVKTLTNEFNEFRTKASKVLQDIENQRKTAVKLKDNLDLQAATAKNLTKTIEASWTAYQAMTTRLAATEKIFAKALKESEYMLKQVRKSA
jgi:type VI protein secretion system component VasK